MREYTVHMEWPGGGTHTEAYPTLSIALRRLAQIRYSMCYGSMEPVRLTLSSTYKN